MGFIMGVFVQGFEHFDECNRAKNTYAPCTCEQVKLVKKAWESARQFGGQEPSTLAEVRDFGVSRDVATPDEVGRESAFTPQTQCVACGIASTLALCDACVAKVEANEGGTLSVVEAYHSLPSIVESPTEAPAPEAPSPEF